MSVAPEALLPLAWRKEDFSRAYAIALASAAGVAWDIPARDINAADLRYYARDTPTASEPQLAVQLKCTEAGLRTAASHPGAWRFSVDVATYDALRHSRAFPPRLLVVVKCPAHPTHWLSHADPTHLQLYGLAWWVSLRGAGELPAGQDSVTVSVPMAQRFDAAAVLENMRSAT